MMRIYEPKPVNLIRLQIRSKGYNTEYITFCDTDLSNAIETVQNIINRKCDEIKISVFYKGGYTSLDFRNCLGGKNGKSQSIKFKGLTPQETKQSILDYFTHK